MLSSFRFLSIQLIPLAMTLTEQTTGRTIIVYLSVLAVSFPPFVRCFSFCFFSGFLSLCVSFLFIQVVQMQIDFTAFGTIVAVYSK